MTNINISVYDYSTGRILERHSFPPENLRDYMAANPSVFYISGNYDDEVFYVASGVAMLRQGMNIGVDKTAIRADGIDQAVIKNIPSGALVRLVSKQYQELTADGTDLVIRVLEPGAYRVMVEKFPFLDFEVTINAA